MASIWVNLDFAIRVRILEVVECLTVYIISGK